MTDAEIQVIVDKNPEAVRELRGQLTALGIDCAGWNDVELVRRSQRFMKEVCELGGKLQEAFRPMVIAWSEVGRRLNIVIQRAENSSNSVEAVQARALRQRLQA